MEDEETQLKNHVRNLLGGYIPKYVARDHQNYTQDLVAELFAEILQPVADYEPTMPAIPPDPFDTLSTKLKLKDLKDYDETWMATSDSVQLLKQMMSTRAESVSQRAIEEDDPAGIFEPPARPLSPTVFSRMERKRTPRQKRLKPLVSEKELDSLRGIAKKYLPARMEEQDEAELAKVEDLVDVKLSLTEEERTAVIALQRSNPFLSTKIDEAKKRVPTKTAAFLSDKPIFDSSSWSSLLQSTRPISPPVFSRDKRGAPVASIFEDSADKDNNPLVPRTPADLLKFVRPVAIPEEDEKDIADANMEVIEEWNDLPTLSSQLTLDTPALDTGTSEIDEDLWLPTSSPKPGQSTNSPNLKSRLIDPRMHEFIMPRMRNPLHEAREKAKQLTGFESYTAFIKDTMPKLSNTPSFISKSTGLGVSVEGGPGSPKASLSVLGHPASLTGDTEAGLPKHEAGESMGDETDSSDRDLLELYKDVKDEPFGDFIMKEKLDENTPIFMQVPKLPSPIDGLCILPKSYASLVIDDKRNQPPGPQSNERSDTEDPMNKFRILRKVTGIKSLTLELNWRPFSFGRSVPSNEEVLDIITDPVQELPKASTGNAPCQDAALRLLKSTVDPDDQSSKSLFQRFVHDSLLASTGPAVEAAIGGLLFPDVKRGREDEHVYTRMERRAMFGDGDLAGNLYEEHVEGVAPVGVYMQDRTEDGQRTTRAYDTFGFDEGVNQQWSDSANSMIDDMKLPYEDCQQAPPIHLHETHLSWGDAQAVPLSQWPEEASSDDLSRYAGDVGGAIHDSGFQSTSPSKSGNNSAYPGDPPCENGQINLFSESSNSAAPIPVDQTGHEAGFSMEQLFQEPKLPEGHVPVESLWSAKALIRRDGFNLLMKLRGKNYTLAHQPPEDSNIQDSCGLTVHPKDAAPANVSKTAPPDLLSASDALVLPEEWKHPTSTIRVFVPISILQKRALVHLLTSAEFGSFSIIEREGLFSGIDIVAGSESAVIYYALSDLPSCRSDLMRQICDSSRRFNNLLVIFTGFPTSRLARWSSSILESQKEKPYAYGPPILNALARFRRDLALHRGSGELSEECSVRVAFADSLEDTAKLARRFVDMTVERDGKDLSPWFTEEEKEGEGDIAMMDGMNCAIANLLLFNTSLQDLLSMTSEQRVEVYAPILSQSRINKFNMIVDNRMRMLDFNDCSSSPQFASD